MYCVRTVILAVLILSQHNYAWAKKCKAQNSVTAEDLTAFSEGVYAREQEAAGGPNVEVRLQAKTRPDSTDDLSPLPLLEVSPAVQEVSTVARLAALYDNYHPNTAIREEETPEERHEQSQLLDAILNTDIWNYTMDFLKSKDFLNGSKKDMKEMLNTMWFTIYSRGKNTMGSSGFEHVFIGEIRGSKVMGMHNWLYFSHEEKNNNTNYLGYMRYVDFGGKGGLIKDHFTWHGKYKPTGSQTVGTSPELDLALYTVCFLARPNCACRLRLAGRRIAVQTYSMDVGGGRRTVGSAFPLM